MLSDPQESVSPYILYLICLQPNLLLRWPKFVSGKLVSLRHSNDVNLVSTTQKGMHVAITLTKTHKHKQKPSVLTQKLTLTEINAAAAAPVATPPQYFAPTVKENSKN